MSKSAAGTMAAEEFERVASTCRWSSRSLNVARALLVDGITPAEAAQANEMTADQARVLRRRFEAKAEAVSKKKVSAEDFMQAVKPNGDPALEPFRRELMQLRKKGYSNEQLLLFLVENGVDTSESNLDQFLSKATSHANSRRSK